MSPKIQCVILQKKNAMILFPVYRSGDQLTSFHHSFKSTGQQSITLSAVKADSRYRVWTKRAMMKLNSNENTPTAANNDCTVFIFQINKTISGNIMLHICNSWIDINLDCSKNIFDNQICPGNVFTQITEPINMPSDPWRLKSSGHQQERYWQYRIGNMTSCSIVNLVFSCWTKSKVWYKIWIHLL